MSRMKEFLEDIVDDFIHYHYGMDRDVVRESIMYSAKSMKYWDDYDEYMRDKLSKYNGGTIIEVTFNSTDIRDRFAETLCINMKNTILKNHESIIFYQSSCNDSKICIGLIFEDFNNDGDDGIVRFEAIYRQIIDNIRYVYPINTLEKMVVN